MSATDVAVFLAALLGALAKADMAANAATGTLKLSIRPLAKIAALTLAITGAKRAPQAR